MRIFILIFFITIRLNGGNADSLIRLIEDSRTPDTSRIFALVELAEIETAQHKAGYNNPRIQRALNILQGIPYQKVKVNAYKKIITYLLHKKDILNAFRLSQEMLNIFSSWQDPVAEHDARYFVLRSVYFENGLNNEFIKEVPVYLKTLEKANPEDKATYYYILGWMEYNLNQMDSALTHMKKSYRLLIHSPKDPGSFLAEVQGWLGNIFSVFNKDSAIWYRKKALQSSIRYNDKFSEADCYRYLAMIYYQNKMYDSSFVYGWKGFDYYYQKKDPVRAIIPVKVYILSGFYLGKLKEANHAMNYFLKDTTWLYPPDGSLPQEYRDFLDDQRNEVLYNYYLKNKKYDKALSYYHRHISLLDSMRKRKERDDIQQKIMELNLRQQIDEIKMKEKENTLKLEKDLQRQRFVFWITVGITGIILFMLFMAYKIIKDKKKSMLIIQQQKNTLEQKNKEIGESIRYARRLQNAIMASPDYIVNRLREYGAEDSFILYIPKDVVAGDFYFFHEQDECLFIAAADATGHGVPGAMVSTICNNCLLTSIKEYTLKTPSDILNKTRDLIIQTFLRSGETVRDGMDISFLCLKKRTSEIQWSGANNPLWIIRSGELKEYPADKQPVGYFEKHQDFHSVSFQPEKGDMVFLFTDGYADQFGGEKGKKLKTVNFKIILTESSHLPMNEIKNKLENIFHEWKGKFEQTDDICIIGIKF